MIVRPVCEPVCRPVCEPVTAAPISGGSPVPDAWGTMAAALPAGFTLWRPQLGHVWQDTARTVPAVVGDPVRVIDDVSGLGEHAVAPADAQRGILRRVDAAGNIDAAGAYQAVILSGTSRYAISVAVNQRTLAAAFDVDGDAGLQGLYGSGALANIVATNGGVYQLRTNSTISVEGATSALVPRVVIGRCDATTQRLRVDAEAEVSNAVTPAAVSFIVIGASSAGGGSSATGKYFGGTIGPASLDTPTDAALRTFLGALIGKTL